MSISPSPDSATLSALDRAVEKAGGVRALCRDLDWHHGSVMRIKAGERLSPYRAAQIAAYLGESPLCLLLEALTDGSKSTAEAKYWASFPAELARQSAQLLHNNLIDLEVKISGLKYKPNPTEKAMMIGELIKLVLSEAWSSSASTSSPEAVVPRKKAS